MLAYEMLGKTIAVREEPHVRARTIAEIAPYSRIEFSSIVPDLVYSEDPTRQWLQLLGQGYCNYIYPPNGERITFTRLFGTVLHDHDLYGLSRPEREGRRARGLPETVRLFYAQPVVLTEAIQVWWFERLRRAAPDLSLRDLRRAWRSLLTSDRFITNFAGSEYFADYINQAHLDREPMRYMPLLTGGAYLWLLGDQPFRLARKDLWRMATIPTQTRRGRPLPMPDIDQFSHPELFYYATNSTHDVLGPIIEGPGAALGWHRRRVEEFPQLGGRSVPIPILSRGPSNAIPAERVRVLPEGADVPSPYVLA